MWGEDLPNRVSVWRTVAVRVCPKSRLVGNELPGAGG